MKRVEIEIKGEKYPCSPTMGAMMRFKEQTGKEVTELDGSSFSDLCTYLWCCVVSACSREGVPFDMGLLEMADCLSPDDLSKWSIAVGSEGEKGSKKKKTP